MDTVFLAHLALAIVGSVGIGALGTYVLIIIRRGGPEGPE